MVKRVLIGALLGGLAYFFWGAFVHMATPIGTMGFSRLPVDKEPAAVAALKEAAPEAGLYFFPGREMGKAMSDSEEKEWEARLAKGPSGMIVYNPAGGEPMSVGQLLRELGIDILVALLASVLLATTRLSFAGRVGFVALLGVHAFASISLSYWNWYHFPADFTLAVLLEEGLGGLVLGLVLASIVRPKAAPAPAA